MPARDPLLAESTDWSEHVNRTLRGIHTQLAMLAHAQKTADAVPAGRRTRELVELMRRLRRRVTVLRRQQATLRTALAVRDLYQRSTVQLAAVRSALVQARQAPQTPAPAAAGVTPGLTSTLAQQQQVLLQQVGQWSSELRNAVIQPLPSLAPSTPHLARRAVDAATRPLPSAPTPPNRQPQVQVAPPREIAAPRHRRAPITPTAPLDPAPTTPVQPIPPGAPAPVDAVPAEVQSTEPSVTDTTTSAPTPRFTRDGGGRSQDDQGTARPDRPARPDRSSDSTQPDHADSAHSGDASDESHDGDHSDSSHDEHANDSDSGDHSDTSHDDGSDSGDHSDHHDDGDSDD
jgi:hypothetical protein